MYSCKVESPKKEPEKKPKAQNKRKNIREIYLNAVHNNRNLKGSLNRTKPISNIQNAESCPSSSNYLESEYNLVKNIIHATKALEKLKTSPNGIPIKNGATKLASSQKHSNNSSTLPSNFHDEELSNQILSLKKTLKLMQNNEIIMKAKFDYYENEIIKKDQEIIDLLDAKKAEEIRTVGESKSDFSTLIYSLKMKSYKLELLLRSKERELTKLKNDLKTTSLKELKIQNEMLRHELSKALMNESKILQSQEINGLFDYINKSNREIESNQQMIATLGSKNQTFRHNISHLSKTNLNSSLYCIKDLNHKLELRGTLREKLEQLDQRETDLLYVICQLNQDLESLKHPHHDGDKRDRPVKKEPDPSRECVDEKDKLNAIKTIQSVMKGHLERSNSLKRNRKNKPRTPSPSPRKHSISPPTYDRPPRPHTPPSLSPPPTPPRPKPPRPVSDDSYSDDSDVYSDKPPKNRLIQKNCAEATDGGCCSPWRSRKEKK